MSPKYCLVLCTCPDAKSAQALAEAVIRDRRAACVSILPGIRSVYRWQGAIDSADEQLLLIKTESAAFEALTASIKSQHPYELPEIIAVPIQQGSAEYLAWISECLNVPPRATD
jgi:periplasmic divalent cation tolerance protein